VKCTSKELLDINFVEERKRIVLIIWCTRQSDGGRSIEKERRGTAQKKVNFQCRKEKK
jgi:hypothetical protein